MLLTLILFTMVEAKISREGGMGRRREKDRERERETEAKRLSPGK